MGQKEEIELVKRIMNPYLLKLEKPNLDRTVVNAHSEY